MFERKGHLKKKLLGRQVTPSKCKEIDAEVGYGHSPYHGGSSMLMSRPGKIPCARALAKKHVAPFAHNYVNAHDFRRYYANVKVNAYDMEPAAK